VSTYKSYSQPPIITGRGVSSQPHLSFSDIWAGTVPIEGTFYLRAYTARFGQIKPWRLFSYEEATNKFFMLRYAPHTPSYVGDKQELEHCSSWDEVRKLALVMHTMEVN
jgi:hypothetical protein